MTLQLLILGLGCLSQGEGGAKREIFEVKRESLTIQVPGVLIPSRHSQIPAFVLVFYAEVRNLTSTDRL